MSDKYGIDDRTKFLVLYLDATGPIALDVMNEERS